MDLNNLFKSQWDRVAAIGLTSLGAIFLIVGWVGISGTAYLAEQAPYIISGGIGGVFLLGLGATLWISADLRDEWRKLDRIEQALGDGTLRWADDSDQGGSAAGYTDELWSGASTPRTASTNGASRSKATAAVKSVAAKPTATTKVTSAKPRTPRPRAGVAHES